MNMIHVGLLLFCSYLIGAVPTGVIIGKIVKKMDVRNVGSGKTGATNVSRGLGRDWGRIALIIDTLKAYGVALVVFICFNEFPLIIGLSLLLIVTGNRFSVILAFFPPPKTKEGKKVSLLRRFKGGSGVASFLGFIFPVMVMCLFKYPHLFTYLGFAVVVASWFTTYKFTNKMMSLTNICATVFIMIYFAFLTILTYFYFYGYLTLFIVLTGIFVILNHRENLRRILKGEEPSTDLI